MSGHTRAALGMTTFTSRMVALKRASIKDVNEIVARCVDTAESGKHKRLNLTIEPVCSLPGPIPRLAPGDTGEKEGKIWNNATLAVLAWTMARPP